MKPTLQEYTRSRKLVTSMAEQGSWNAPEVQAGAQLRAAEALERQAVAFEVLHGALSDILRVLSMKDAAIAKVAQKNLALQRRVRQLEKQVASLTAQRG